MANGGVWKICSPGQARTPGSSPKARPPSTELRLRKASIQTLGQYYALAPAKGEPDPEPDPKPAFDPAPVLQSYAPRITFELAKKLGKTLPPDLVPDPNEAP